MSYSDRSVSHPLLPCVNGCSGEKPGARDDFRSRMGAGACWAVPRCSPRHMIRSEMKQLGLMLVPKQPASPVGGSNTMPQHWLKKDLLKVVRGRRTPPDCRKCIGKNSTTRRSRKNYIELHHSPLWFLPSCNSEHLRISACI